jgi:beta-glucosidase
VETVLTISCVIQNTGNFDGNEVVQLYLAFPPSSGEPPQVLRGFQKVFLEAGQSSYVSFHLHQKDVSIWDVTNHDWSVVSGTFKVFIGASSRDFRLAGTFQV